MISVPLRPVEDMLLQTLNDIEQEGAVSSEEFKQVRNVRGQAETSGAAGLWPVAKVLLLALWYHLLFGTSDRYSDSRNEKRPRPTSLAR